MNRTTLSRRVLLGAGFSLSYGFSAVGGLVVAAMLGLRSAPALAAAFLAAGGLGLVVAAAWAPRLEPDGAPEPLDAVVTDAVARHQLVRQRRE